MADQDGRRLTPVAFMSYAHFNDEHDKGRLTELRQRLAGETSALLGEDFVIFQDRNEVLWGQQWKPRIEDGIDQSTFLIPILTPHFFKSTHCCEELKRFLERERTLGRSDLLLPVYYLDCAVFNDSRHRDHSPLMRTLAARQLADWREFRFERLDGTAVLVALAALARQIRDALVRDANDGTRSVPDRPASHNAVDRSDAGSAGQSAAPSAQEAVSSEPSIGRSAGPAPRTEPRTWIVDPIHMHQGDFTTISAAIAAANSGDRIVVRPGTYREGLVIDKVLEIIGDGFPGDVIVKANGKCVILFKAIMGRIANLTLRQQGGGERFAVDICQGRLSLEDCDISSASLACMAIHNGADPFLRCNKIHGSKEVGVLVYENGRGTLEDNEIYGNTFAGVQIRQDSDPVLRCNIIYDGKQNGVCVHENGRGRLEDNDIFKNALSGVEVKTGGNPVLRKNRIHHCTYPGVLVFENGRGTLEDDNIFSNDYSGVEVKSGGDPVLRNNHINRNKFRAIYVHDGGSGTFEDNDLRDNGRGPWLIIDNCESKVKRARNTET